MSSDPSAAAFARLDAAADESPPAAAAPPRDLVELAAALARVEALLAAGAADVPDGAAAVERIADIAFVLHEREVERSLCDALDAAVREIGAADAVKLANAQRAREAAELIRELSRALGEMVATVRAKPQPQAAATVAEDEPPAPAGLFEAPMAEDDAFALTVAALAKGLPEPAAAVAPPHEMPETIAAEAAVTHSDNTVEAPTSWAAVEPVPSNVEAVSEPMPVEEMLAEQMPVEETSAAALPVDSLLPGPSASESASGEDEPAAVASAEPPEPDAMVLANAPSQAPADEAANTGYDEPVAATQGDTTAIAPPDRVAADAGSDLQIAASAVSDHDHAPPAAEADPVAAAEPIDRAVEARAYDEQDAAPHQAAPPPSVGSHPSIDPDEDPGDLFEPMADARPAASAFAPASIAAPPSHGDAVPGDAVPVSGPSEGLPLAAAAAVEVKSQQPASVTPRLSAGAPAHGAPRAAANDPLAPIRALSEEETIALFS
jgi:hypothetical protein